MSALDQARQFALSLPGASEEPHFEMSSFRVRGKIFATVTPGEDWLHVFVDGPEIEASVAEDPAVFEPLRWGQRVAGLRIRLSASPPPRLAELIEDAWRRKAPRRLIAARDTDEGRGQARDTDTDTGQAGDEGRAQVPDSQAGPGR